MGVAVDPDLPEFGAALIAAGAELARVEAPRGSPARPVSASELADKVTDLARAIYPQGAEQILRDTATQFPGFPLVMTENGVADAADKYRPRFIHETLHYLDSLGSAMTVCLRSTFAAITTGR